MHVPFLLLPDQTIIDLSKLLQVVSLVSRHVDDFLASELEARILIWAGLSSPVSVFPSQMVVSQPPLLGWLCVVFLYCEPPAIDTLHVEEVLQRRICSPSPFQMKDAVPPLNQFSGQGRQVIDCLKKCCRRASVQDLMSQSARPNT